MTVVRPLQFHAVSKIPLYFRCMCEISAKRYVVFYNRFGSVDCMVTKEYSWRFSNILYPLHKENYPIPNAGVGGCTEQAGTNVVVSYVIN